MYEPGGDEILMYVFYDEERGRWKFWTWTIKDASSNEWTEINWRRAVWRTMTNGESEMNGF